MKRIIIFICCMLLPIDSFAESVRVRHHASSDSGYETGDSSLGFVNKDNKKIHYFIGGGFGISAPFYSEYSVYSCDNSYYGSYCTDTDLSYDFPSFYFNFNMDGGVKFGKRTDFYNYGFSAFYNFLPGESISVSDYNDVKYDMSFSHSIFGLSFDNYFELQDFFPVSRGYRSDFLLGIGYAGVNSEIVQNGVDRSSVDGAFFFNFGTIASWNGGLGIYFYTKYYFPQDTIDIIFEGNLGLRYTF